ncbi:uncharacterized protein LOC108950586 [Ciona intestinalis]
MHFLSRKVNIELLSTHTGPFSYERWYLGGSEHAQPDNKWCVENCGAMRLDLTDAGKSEFSDISNEYWVDEWCGKKKPFVCESVLPSQCPTYNPPLVQSCVEHYFAQAGCTASLSADSLTAFSSLTLKKMSVLTEEIYAKSTDLKIGVFHELCTGEELLDLGLTPKFRFYVKKQTHADAKSTCADNMEILPSLITSELAEVVRKKVEDSLKITGVEKWWIGLDDIVTEGSFVWSNGEQFGHYTNWSPTRSGSVSANDCVAAGADGNAYWTEEACTDAFTFVCMTNYPDGCTTLNGGHTVECLNNLWKRVGCVEVGDKYPQKQSSAILYTMKNTALTSLETDIESSKASADTGSKPEQLNCYGIELPDNCLSFYGPYSIDCLNSIWNIRGCLNKGTKAPSKLNPSERTSLDALNLKSLDQHMLEYRTEADSGNSQKQTECFGIVFYENCATFYGPHSMECLISTWENVGCRVNGEKYPPKLQEFDLEPLVDMNLVEMDAAMKVSKILADQGGEQHQLNCYGLAFPENCPTYNGPHSVDCLTTIWNLKGCRNDGTHAPVKLPTSEQDVLVAYNLNQLLDHVINKKSLADAGDNVGQLECFGTVFPDGCTTYSGPHTMDCLIGVWKHVDCKDRGEEYPPKLSTAEADTLKYLNLPMLIANRQAVKTAAAGGDATQQTNCYGVVFEDSCTSFTGPHSMECLTGIWESKGCLSEGTKAPVKLRDSERNALDLLNLKTIEVNFKTVRTEADSGDADKVLECYGIGLYFVFLPLFNFQFQLVLKISI